MNPRIAFLPRNLRLLSSLALLISIAACGDDDSANTNGGDASPTIKDGATSGDASAAGDSDSDLGSPQDGLTIAIKDGKVQGDMAGKSRLFLKIPYAKPPLGELRWKAPVKNDAWQDVRHEAKFSDACAQNASSGSPASASEDCLYLNVWSPDPAPKDAPVMFWIHGGGNFAGSTFDHVPGTEQLWFDGQAFAERHGIVVVTTNYRLGPMGFFAHPALADEDSPVGNQGLLDQRAALQWVHDNIANFGGDAGNVTIFGESAGSADVCYHVASPGSRGLFQRAISQSGGCTTGPQGGSREPSSSDVAEGMLAFTKKMGCDTAKDAIACLREKPVQDLLDNGMQPNPMGAASTASSFRFSVVMDGPGGFLPDSARNLFDKGDVAKVPYILGSNNDEGTLFTYTTPAPKDDDEYLAAIAARFGDSADKIFAQYPVSRFDGNYGAAMARVVGDSGLICGTHDSARRAVEAGLSVFMYNFNIAWQVAPTLLFAAHASEISHVFGTPLNPDADSQKVSDAMNAYWAQFAKTGDPNGSDTPVTWPAFEPDSDDHDKRLQFDADFEIVDDFRREDCAMWREIYAGS